MEGGHPFIILSSGYIGSALFGGAFILGGWDTLVAKILSFFLGLGLVIPIILVRDKLSVQCTRSASATSILMRLFGCRTILLTLFYEGLLVGFWFVDHAWVFPSVFTMLY